MASDDEAEALSRFVLELDELPAARPPSARAARRRQSFVPLAAEHVVGADGWQLGAAAALRHNGFCVLRHARGTSSCVDPELCAPCAKSAVRRLEQLLAQVRTHGISPRREIFRFAEICCRTAGGLRYDMRLPLLLQEAGENARSLAAMLSDTLEGEEVGSATGMCSNVSNATDAWMALHRAIDTVARPVVCKSGLLAGPSAYDHKASFAYDSLEVNTDVCYGTAPPELSPGSSEPAVSPCKENSHTIDSAGCVTSLPGAGDQHFHPDGTAAGLITAFVALVPVDRQNGPTELRPGSHIWRDTQLGPEPLWDENTCTFLPDLGVGEILLFDYRVYHRGCANISEAPRPVGYIVYARKGVSDTHNFPSQSAFDAPIA